MADRNDVESHGPRAQTDFPDDVTQPLPLALSLDSAGRGQWNPLFVSLSEALDLSESAIEQLISELLVYVDATPASLTAAQLWNMRTGLFELVDKVLPPKMQSEARSRLEILMLEVAPVDRDDVD